ncbi:hypothetical protein EMIHUDRAFT_448817 [Emiliania huxleyi CCMP1516]|uniref:Uncharacterized protein n=2 Tax=Emiliania huxleyi TaxID=2903 RepID=A0A0D3KUK2_EMIH1|nr:hypothetical protein EMIHUDRAFT_448817 [Emiliania huxleyi CCMP1516]EOD39437.1 hypothetical protein EMIHUDRAFT_448817 [Emiliania huxleyi CCMP1516]|eukprot:XP_005791866.1 hypothetical protein EMIHUDRAFT_448817 [Emiliania huxleyi CCMP1516]
MKKALNSSGFGPWLGWVCMSASRKSVTLTLLDDGASEGHRFGINALASTCASAWGSSRELFTGGRDGSVRCWREPEGGGVPRLRFTVDEHTDWVNDLALLTDGDLTSAVVSASSDRTIKLWRPEGETGTPSKCYTLRQHTDFVKVLGYAADAGTLASAGCDCCVVVWDVARLAPRVVIGGSEGARAHGDSIYALAVKLDGGLIATGAVDATLRLWDPRAQAAAVGSLVGHTDVVRGIAISADGGCLVSCSSDRSVKLWSIGQRRVQAELRRRTPARKPHSDSVFCIDVDESCSRVLYGGRDGLVLPRGSCVRRFDAGEKYDKLLAELAEPTAQRTYSASWFTASARSGALELTLCASSTFNAEGYASELGIAGQEDFRVNLGEQLLCALFASWRERQKPSRAAANGAGGSGAGGGGAGGANSGGAGSDGGGGQCAFRSLEQTPVLICDGSVVTARSRASRLGDLPDGAVPSWVGQAVLHAQFSPRAPLKLSFFLQPHPASGLPLLPPDCNKLAAATALRLDKVIAYVEERVPSGKPLALFASGKPLAPDMSLGAVRAFVWKSADEMVLQYKQA